jgi:hypothetical protein
LKALQVTQQMLGIKQVISTIWLRLYVNNGTTRGELKITFIELEHQFQIDSSHELPLLMSFFGEKEKKRKAIDSIKLNVNNLRRKTEKLGEITANNSLLSASGRRKISNSFWMYGLRCLKAFTWCIEWWLKVAVPRSFRKRRNRWS